jgi:eukaryotic-like serine/threonine-protein kinase
MARFWRRRQPAPAAATRTTEEQVETVPPRRPTPFWPWLLLLLALVLGALAASWYFTTRDDTVEATEVPNVVGVQREAAERELDERGFNTEVKRVVSPRPAGTVVAQRPPSGTKYGKGGIVVLSVARDPLQVEVPDVTGLQVGQAQNRLRAAGLQPRAENVAAQQPQGRVLRQVPAAGTEVPKESPVVVIVSAGPQLADVPDVVGLTTDDATARLTQAGFRTRVRQVTASEPEGTVVAQEPLGGTRAQRGRVVQIDVSRGQTQTATTVVTTTTASAQGTVPDTVGQDEQTATFTIEDAGYRVRVTNRTVTDPSQDGTVVQQLPRGGTRRTGSTVTIVVGRLQ